MLTLSPRLHCAASLLQGGRTVDIGTDHAFLPVYLIQNGKCEHVLACDIGLQPLKNAEKTIVRFGLSSAIELRLSDGLQNVQPDEADEICICGMGGTLIVDILSAIDWIRRPGQRLVLQPMTHADDVREFLCRSGFSITREMCMRDGKRVYCCIAAVYDGNVDVRTPGYWYFGTLMGGKGDASQFVKREYTRIKKAEAALAVSGRRPRERERLRLAIDEFERFMNDG